jgi:4-amino-4-deoxy-L-arabinose transferase-like glycosyltransferase
MTVTTSEAMRASSPAVSSARGITVARPLLVAGLCTAAAILALVAQGYLSRRVYLADSVFLYIAAIALFIAAFPHVGQEASGGWLRRGLRWLLAAAALGIFLKAYGDLSQNRDYVQSIALLLAPLPLIGAAFAGSRSLSVPDDAPDQPSDGIWQRIAPTSAQRRGDILFLILGSVLAVVAFAYWFKTGRTNEAIIVNLLSLTILFLAIYRIDRGAQPTNETMVGASPLLLELAALGAIVAFGGFLRLWLLDTVPFGIWYDEGETGLEALRIFNGIPYTPIGTYSHANPSLFFYVIAFVYKIMGPTLLSVRLVQAVTGLLAVPALYALLRYTLGWRTAIVGALLLAASTWHVNFSRFGMPYSIGAPLFEILTILFLVWGLRSGRLTAFALCGVAAGLGLQTYTGFRIFPIALVIYVVYGFVLGKDRVRQNIAGFFVLALMVVMTFAPLGTWAIRNWPEFSSRMGQTSVFAGKNTDQERMAALENSLRRHVAMLNYHGDGNGRHNLPGAPAVDFITGAALVVGLGYCLYRWRSPFYLLLAAWFLVTMMAGVMSLDWEAPQQARTIVAIPAICAVAAVALGKIWTAWDNATQSVRNNVARVATWRTAFAPLRRLRASLASAPLARLAVAAVAVAVLVGVGYVNYNQYFNRHMRNSEAYYSFSTIETVVARRVAELGPTTNRYFIQNIGTPAYTFLVGGDSPQRPVDAVFYRAYAHMPLREAATKPAVYLLEPWRVTIEPADVLRYYPNSEFIDHKDPFGKTMVYEFRIPADDINNLLGLTGRYYAGDQPQGAPLLERVDKTLSFNGRAQPPVADAFNVEWTGSLVPPDAGAYTFHLASDGDVRLSLDGEWLDLGPNGNQVRIELAKGLHPIILQLRGTTLDVQWTLPNGQRQPIPTTALIAQGPPENGLVGRYYRGETWQGRPEFVQVDPYLAFRWHPDPIEPVPWSAIWTGRIEIPTAGKYLFQGVSNDRMWLIIDGRTYMDGVRSMAEVQIDLTAGRHDIQVKYANNKGYSELRLMWRSPDGQFEAVPNQYLFTK